MIERVLLVGESNPYGNDPHFALYPSPERSAGYRLCVLIFEMQRKDYLELFDRCNLCVGLWSMRRARKKAATLADRWAILCGAKVARAFGHEFRPLEVIGDHLIIPHPSGLSRAWNEPDAMKKVRDAMRAFVLAWSDAVEKAAH
jgi:hypothetical protein